MRLLVHLTDAAEGLELLSFGTILDAWGFTIFKPVVVPREMHTI